jgi:hypothetical protein
MAYKITANEEIIRGWIERRNGTPAIVRGSADTLQGLTILFGAEGGRSDLEPISWEEFFDTFNSGRLLFKYSDAKIENGNPPGFTFISRDNVAAFDDTDEPILPEENDMARENIFGSAPPAFEMGLPPEEAE